MNPSSSPLSFREDETALALWTEYPAAERVAAALADLLFAADETLALLHDDRAHSLAWMEPIVRHLYDEVNEMIREIAD